ncbi:hypothetical protein ABH897_003435 [Paenibacillus sp. RC73]|uniref:hypothetical protein n=1 Tax=Paenibacillus sp. RC73 TaxID=3156250 RepID=UPI0038333244
MGTITVNYGRFQGSVIFASEAAYEADKRVGIASGRIGTIKSDLTLERKRLANPKYPAEYKDETAAIIERLEVELLAWQGAYQTACEEFSRAGGVV